MIIVLYGPPGSGKGSQAQKLKEKCDFTHLSTGDLLREEVANNTELGQKIDADLKSGKLIANEIVVKLVEKYMEDHKPKKLIFDGFPRNLEQAKELDEVLSNNNQKIDKVVKFDITFKTLMDRILNRLICADCGKVYNMKGDSPQKPGECDACKGHNLVRRKDDTEQVVKERFHIYESETERVLDYYSSQGILSSIDAQQNIDGIFSQLVTTIGGQDCKGVE